jgi:hypothetical protein
MFTSGKVNAAASEPEEISRSSLISDIQDAIAEQLCGGTMTPDTATDASNTTTPETNTKNAIPSPASYQKYGLTPFFPNLPATKLPRLGSLDPSARQATQPKNAITITIPLPRIVY